MSGMAKFRKKPVEIEAMQYTEESRNEIIDWSGAQHSAIDDDGVEYELLNLRIKTLEGTLMVRPYDWIIKGVAGEFYPCKRDIFEATHEPVE